MTKTTPKKNDYWMPLVIGSIFLIAIIFAAYQPALRAGFVWDDEDLVFGNSLVTDVGGFRDIWLSTKFYDYYPLTLTSFWAEWRLWGNNAQGYHVINIFLHAFSAIFFWRCLNHLKIPAAWLIALLFAVHPVNVESVAWIAQRKNTLSLFFYALSLLFYLRNENSTPAKNQKTLAYSKWYWLSLGTFLLALLSKTSVVMLPVVLLGCAWWQHKKIRRIDVLKTIPFFLLALVLGLVTVWVQYNRAIATDVVHEGNFWMRLAGAGWAIWFYLWKILVPLNLSFVYPRWNIDPQSIVSFLPTLAAVLCLVLFWSFRKTWGRAPLFAFGYFVVTLFPVLGFFNIYFQKYSFVADHWQYQSMIAPIAFVFGTIAAGWKKFAKENRQTIEPPPPVYFAGFILAIALSALTFQQTKIYANAESLWQDTVQKNPNAWIAHNLLGAELSARGQLDEAKKHYSEAVRLNPNHAEAHNNLGTSFAIRGNLTQAIEHFRAACRLNPKLTMAANSLAWILATHPNPKFRDGTEAVRLAEQAAQFTTHADANTLETLAAAYAETGQFSEAIKTATRGIEAAKSAAENEIAEQLAAEIKLYELRRPMRDQTLPAQ